MHRRHPAERIALDADAFVAAGREPSGVFICYSGVGSRPAANTTPREPTRHASYVAPAQARLKRRPQQKLSATIRWQSQLGPLSTNLVRNIPAERHRHVRSPYGPGPDTRLAFTGQATAIHNYDGSRFVSSLSTAGTSNNSYLRPSNSPDAIGDGISIEANSESIVATLRLLVRSKSPSNP